MGSYRGLCCPWSYLTLLFSNYWVDCAWPKADNSTQHPPSMDQACSVQVRWRRGCRRAPRCSGRLRRLLSWRPAPRWPLGGRAPRWRPPTWPAWPRASSAPPAPCGPALARLRVDTTLPGVLRILLSFVGKDGVILPGPGVAWWRYIL